MRLSETTLRIRDEERQDLIDEARRAAQKLIVAHRVQLDALAYELLEHEVLDREAIERIMSGVPRLERAPGVGLRVVAAAKPHDAPASPAAIDARRAPVPTEAPYGSRTRRAAVRAGRGRRSGPSPERR